MLYSVEQMKAYAHARELIPEISTLADLHALTESHAELVARVAELEADKSAGLDMIRDRLDADPTTVAEAVEGLIGLYKIEFDQRFKLETQLSAARGGRGDYRRRYEESERKVADLQAELERAHRQLACIGAALNDFSQDGASRANTARMYLSEQIDQATEDRGNSSNMPIEDARKIIVEAAYKHEHKAALDLVDTQILIEAAMCVATALDRATETRASFPAMPVSKGDEQVIDELVARRQSEKESRKMATKPRPMSEAPRVWVGEGKTGSVWLWCETPGTGGKASWRRWGWVEKGQVFMPPNATRPCVGPASMDSLETCREVDWLPLPERDVE